MRAQQMLTNPERSAYRRAGSATAIASDHPVRYEQAKIIALGAGALLSVAVAQPALADACRHN